MNKPSQKEFEELRLPDEFSLGSMFVLSWNDGRKEPGDRIEARGRILIPREAKTIHLDASQDMCDNLWLIHQLPIRFLELLNYTISFSKKTLDKADFGALGSIPELKRLSVVDCDYIRSDQLHQISRLKLEMLSLAGTEWEKSDYSWLSNLGNLKTLILRSTNVNDNCLPFISRLNQMEYVDFCCSKLSDTGVRTLWLMHNLKTIRIGGDEISDLAFNGMRNCRSLIHLEVFGTNITDKGINIITNEITLGDLIVEILEFWACSITDYSIHDLTKLKNIRRFQFAETSITKKGIELLQKSLPECRVFIFDKWMKHH